MTLEHPAGVAFGVFAAYLALVVVLWWVNKVDYDSIFATRRDVVRGIIVPIGLGGVLLAVALTVLGWWRPVMFEESRTGPVWALAVPVLFALAILSGLTSVRWRSGKATVLPWIAIGVLLVGFAEEVATRGVLIVGLRDAGWSETWVFLTSTGLFALLHAVNVLFGQSLRTTLLQIGMAFAAGSALYVTRMTTGTLLVGIVLHALWDFTTGGAAATGGTPKPRTALLAFASYGLGIVAVVVLLTS